MIFQMYHLLVLSNEIIAKRYFGITKLKTHYAYSQDASTFRILRNSVVPPRLLLSLLIATKKRILKKLSYVS